jgi:tRNA(Met) cytidine acetyltransferase
VRVGVTRGAASGTYSVIVLQALSARGEALCAEARGRFLDHLPLLLSDPLRDLDPGLAAALLRREVPPEPVRLDAQDWRDLVAFGFGLRGYEVSLVPIWRLVCAALADPQASALLEGQAVVLVIGKVLQRRSWQELARELDLPGRAQVVEALRRALRPLILRLGDPSVQAQVERLRGL